MEKVKGQIKEVCGLIEPCLLIGTREYYAELDIDLYLIAATCIFSMWVLCYLLISWLWKLFYVWRKSTFLLQGILAVLVICIIMRCSAIPIHDGFVSTSGKKNRDDLHMAIL